MRWQKEYKLLSMIQRSWSVSSNLELSKDSFGRAVSDRGGFHICVVHSKQGDSVPQEVQFFRLFRRLYVSFTSTLQFLNQCQSLERANLMLEHLVNLALSQYKRSCLLGLMALWYPLG